MVGPRLKEYLPDAALEREFLVYEGKPLCRIFAGWGVYTEASGGVFQDLATETVR